MELDLTQIIEAVLAAVVTISLPYLLALLRRKLKIDMDEKDAAALAVAINRALAYAIDRVSGPGGITVNRPEGIIGDALDYLLRLSPKLVHRVTEGEPAKLASRIRAELAAKVPSKEAPNA